MMKLYVFSALLLQAGLPAVMNAWLHRVTLVAALVRTHLRHSPPQKRSSGPCRAVPAGLVEPRQVVAQLRRSRRCVAVVPKVSVNWQCEFHNMCISEMGRKHCLSTPF